MSQENMWTEFQVYWNAPEQEELRMSCAKGWAFHVWQASRAAMVERCRELQAESERLKAESLKMVLFKFKNECGGE